MSRLILECLSHPGYPPDDGPVVFFTVALTYTSWELTHDDLMKMTHSWRSLQSGFSSSDSCTAVERLLAHRIGRSVSLERPSVVHVDWSRQVAALPVDGGRLEPPWRDCASHSRLCQDCLSIAKPLLRTEAESYKATRFLVLFEPVEQPNRSPM